MRDKKEEQQGRGVGANMVFKQQIFYAWSMAHRLFDSPAQHLVKKKVLTISAPSQPVPAHFQDHLRLADERVVNFDMI